MTDLQEAAAIWRGLGEHRSAAAPAWDAILLDTSLPKSLVKHVETESPVVRVAVIEAYRKELAASGAAPPAALLNPVPVTCDEFVRRGKEWVAVNVIDW